MSEAAMTVLTFLAELVACVAFGVWLGRISGEALGRVVSAAVNYCRRAREETHA